MKDATRIRDPKIKSEIRPHRLDGLVYSVEKPRRNKDKMDERAQPRSRRRGARTALADRMSIR